MATADGRDAWMLDQLAKSQFFHVKLHKWGLLEVATEIEQTRGESLLWNLSELSIAQDAWDKVIHRGIKPVLVFAHPEVLTSIARSTSYYRMLSMVSQKSMKRIRLNTEPYEDGAKPPAPVVALAIAQRLNEVISRLIVEDEKVDAREFDLWRGMAAGTQAQGSWQNEKGDSAELVVKGIVQLRLRERNQIAEEHNDEVYVLTDGRTIAFSDEPDIAIYSKASDANAEETILAAVEVKGGIDVAGVLERVGAAIKSLHRAKQSNPASTTVLIMQRISITPRAEADLLANHDSVNYWFSVENILEDRDARDQFFALVGI